MRLHSKFSVQRSAFSVRPARSHPCRSGFTLIELMVVLVIIMILVGIVVGASKYAIGKAARSRAQSEIAMIENALESYKSDNGIYPRSTLTRSDAVSNSGSLYAALVAGPGNPKTYFNFKANQIRAISATETNIMDTFGMPYNYYCNPGAADQKSAATFDLWSYGPNNINDEGANDDITSWKQ
jgi:general secretion pathway protein G